MYCKYCRKEIADNSKFCPECGKQIQQEEIKNISTETTTEKEENNSAWKGCGLMVLALVFFIVILGIALGIIFGVSSCDGNSKNQSTSSSKQDSSLTNNDENKIFSRNATLNDVNIIWQENSIAYQGTLIPKEDIENLIITFNFYNENKTQIIKTIEKRFGDVTENQQYEFTISIAELGLSNSSNTGGAKYSVTSGQIKYIN